MSYERIRVTAYSGHRDNESPRTFSIYEELITVVEIVDRWIEESLHERARKRFFIVKTDKEQRYKMYVDEKTSEWFCEKK